MEFFFFNKHYTLNFTKSFKFPKVIFHKTAIFFQISVLPTTTLIILEADPPRRVCISKFNPLSPFVKWLTHSWILVLRTVLNLHLNRVTNDYMPCIFVTTGERANVKSAFIKNIHYLIIKLHSTKHVAQ